MCQSFIYDSRCYIALFPTDFYVYSVDYFSNGGIEKTEQKPNLVYRRLQAQEAGAGAGANTVEMIMTGALVDPNHGQPRRSQVAPAQEVEINKNSISTKHV